MTDFLQADKYKFKTKNTFTWDSKWSQTDGNFTMANLGISNPFQKLFRLHGDFTAATFQTIARF